MNKQPMISICIPTYNRPKALKELLDSILLEDVNKDLYEICIADDSTNFETQKMVQEYTERYQNVLYRKNTERQKYMNMINALRMGKGKLLKLNNDYLKYRPGALETMLEDIRKYDEENTFIIFAKTYSKQNVITFTGLSQLMKVVTYHITWCSSFAMWKKDFDECLVENVNVDPFFPHMDLLFKMKEKKQYIVYGKKYYTIQKIGFQGGYHFPKEFGEHFLDMIYELRKTDRIDQEAWNAIKSDTVKLIARSHARQVKSPKRYGCYYDEWYKYLLKYNKPVSVIRYIYLFLFYFLVERKTGRDT